MPSTQDGIPLTSERILQRPLLLDLSLCPDCLGDGDTSELEP